MKSSQTIAPPIQQFLDNALAHPGQGHTLALAERHDEAEHISWLRDNLGALKQRNVTTVGLEYPAFMNVFLSAYADGTLEQVLGSKSAAQNYLRTIFLALAQYPDAKPNASGKALLAMEAIDNGMRVVAYDSRIHLLGLGFQWSNEQQAFSYRAPHSVPTDDLRRIRRSPDILKQFSAHGMDETQWLLGEISWALEKNPSYNKKLGAIEGLIMTGHSKIHQGKLGSDALSACLFDSLADPSGNRVTIGGIGHIDGMGSKSISESQGNPVEEVSGTFHAHLSAMRASAGNQSSAPKVTRAAIAGVGMAESMPRNIAFDLSADTRNHARDLPVVKDTPIRMVDITTSKITDLPNMPEQKDRSVSLPKKFSADAILPRGIARTLNPKERAALTQGQINPLLIPEIARAADAVRLSANFEQPARVR